MHQFRMFESYYGGNLMVEQRIIPVPYVGAWEPIENHNQNSQFEHLTVVTDSTSGAPVKL
jgi:hypothetical protein